MYAYHLKVLVNYRRMHIYLVEFEGVYLGAGWFGLILQKGA